MDEQRAWLRSRRRKRLRLLAALLTSCLLITNYPDILQTIPVSATESGQEQDEIRESKKAEYRVTGFEELQEEVWEQTVPVGTGIEELTLPEEITATVTAKEDAGKQEEAEREKEKEEGSGEGTEEGTGGENSGEGTEEGTGGENSGEGTEEGTSGENGGEGTEEGTGGENGGEGTEEGTGGENGGEGTGEGTGGENSGEGTGEGAGGEDTDAENTEKESNTEKTGENGDVSAEPTQETHTVTLPEYQAENVISIETLEGTQNTEPENTAKTTVTINGITWQSEPAYDGNTEGTYIFTAILPDSYTLAEGVSLPQITVTVQESIIDAAVQALLDRIAALPDAEEYLSEEPDVEEEAYAEWEEKLYEYAEEVLAIWETYETLTKEQQEQIPEEAQAKLAAWVELAEQLAGNDAVMLADGTHHTGWNVLTASNTVLKNGNYYLTGPITMETITIQGDVTLCLCGQTLTHSDNPGSVIKVESGTFTLCDCSGDNSGCITGGKGTAAGTNNTLSGGGVYVGPGATFNMYGGSIKGNTATVGGGICIDDNNATPSTFYMYGGEITNNETTGKGGGISCGTDTKKYILGGSIEKNDANGQGGGLFINSGGNEGGITISNVSIVNNTSKGVGGGIHCGVNSILNMQGEVKITGNFNNGKIDNVFLRNGLYLNITGNLEDSDIGVTVQKPPSESNPTSVKIASGSNDYSISVADWSCFGSDNEACEILRKETDSGNELYLVWSGSCDLGGLNLSTEGATLSPTFDPDITAYTSTVENRVDKVGITATLADTATDASITMKVNGGTGKTMTSGEETEALLTVGKNTIEVTVTSGGMSKTYTLVITREELLGYSVTITAYKNGNVWTDDPPDLKLSSDNGESFVKDLTAVPDGTYHIYECKNNTNTDTGVTVDVKGADTTVGVNYYTVTFYDGDTPLTAPAQQIVLKGSTATKPSDPTKDGYAFFKWVTANGGSATYNFTAAVTGVTSVYASWTPVEYEITYILDGGTATGNPASYTIESDAITLTKPTKEGYTFTGWSGTELDGENNMTVTIPKGSTGNREYTAHWQAESYKITYKDAGNEDLSGTFSGEYPTKHTYGTETTLVSPAKTGYTFAGWYKDSGCTQEVKDNKLAATGYTDEITLYAKWTAKQYEVSFDYHGADGGNTTEKKTVTYDSAYGELPAPTRTGYAFKGWWYTEADGKDTKIDAETIVETASDHTLQACWKDETAPDKPVLQDGVTLPSDWTKDQTEIPLKLYDGVGVTELWVSIDGKDYVKADGFTSGTGNVEYGYPVTEGEHTYRFKAKDAAGNLSDESDPFTVKLDTKTPAIGAITCDNSKNFLDWIIGKVTGEKRMIIHVPVTDEGSGVTQITYTMTPRDIEGNLDSGSASQKTANVKDGKAEITFDAGFRGTIAITCTDAAGNSADGVTIGASGGGVIVEDRAPDIAAKADRNPSDTQRTQPDGVDIAQGYYETAPKLVVTVKDDTDNAITAGIDTVTYQVGDGTPQPVNVDKSTLQKAAQVTFTISAIPTGITTIKIYAADNAGNETTENITVKVKGPEKQPKAEIDYREEELKALVSGGKYTINGTEVTADAEGRVKIATGWFDKGISIIKKGNGSETTDSPAQELNIPARPAAPNAPELNSRTENEITLKTISGARYRLDDGTAGENWQDGTTFAGLTEKTVYTFRAYYPATDTSFASPQSNEAKIATMPDPPAADKLTIDYAAETLALADGIEAFAGADCTTPVTAGSAEDHMGKKVYIRYPARDIIPASRTTEVTIPARAQKPAPGKTDTSYPGAADGAITGLTAGTAYEVRVKDEDGNFGAWKDAALTGTEIKNLPAGEYEVRVKGSKEAGFHSEAAAVTIGETPATKHDTPDIRIGYADRTLTGFDAGGEYTINGKAVTVRQDGTIAIEKEWFDSVLTIIRKGNKKDKADSDAQSLSVPAIPPAPSPTGVDADAPGDTGKLTGLTAGTTYEVSTDGGRTWQTRSADGNGAITGLAPGNYTVRVKAGASNFASEKSAPVNIGAFQIKVTFMANGEQYVTRTVDYGGTLTDIPDVPPKKDAGDKTYAGEWCADAQGSAPAVFKDIKADMTVYAVYTRVCNVTLQGGTGYTLTAESGSASPVKEGGSFTFRFALSGGYEKTDSFAVKVNGVKVELTEDDTYTINGITEDQTVTVEGVKKKSGGTKPGGSDPDKDKDKEPGGGDNGGDHDGGDGGSGGTEDKKPGGTDDKKPGGKDDKKPDDTEDKKPGDTADKKPGDTEDKKPGDTGGKKPGDTGGTEKEQPPEGEPATTPAVLDDGRIVTADGPVRTGNVKDMTSISNTLPLGEGAVIVTVVCEEQAYTAGVADTAAVANAVLTPEQTGQVQSGETIEIRIDVKDISDKVPKQDKEVIEKGMEEYRKEVPGLTLGMYVDISMFIRIGEGDWNAVTKTGEPVEVIVGIPEELQETGRIYYIIRAHEGEYTFMDDMDDAQDTITISTDMFSSYAIAYVETDGGAGAADTGAKCGLCHICPTFLGICLFIWLAVIVVTVLVIWIILRRKGEEEKAQEK